jgi:hypothetical protein
VRIIDIYLPRSQKRNLNDILSFLIGETILSDDFNVTVKEWINDSPFQISLLFHVKQCSLAFR